MQICSSPFSPVSKALGYSMNEDIYSSPNSDLEEAISPNKGMVAAILGTVLQLPFPYGVVSFLIGMLNLFHEINVNGSGDPKVLAGGISEELVPVILGLVLAMPGFILSIYTLLKGRYRSWWFLTANIIYATTWIVLFPFGTVLGVVYFVVIYTKRGSRIKPNKLSQRDAASGTPA